MQIKSKYYQQGFIEIHSALENGFHKSWKLKWDLWKEVKFRLFGEGYLERLNRLCYVATVMRFDAETALNKAMNNILLTAPRPRKKKGRRLIF